MYARRKSKAPKFSVKKPIVSEMQLRKALQKIAEQMRRQEEAARDTGVAIDAIHASRRRRPNMWPTE